MTKPFIHTAQAMAVVGDKLVTASNVKLAHLLRPQYRAIKPMIHSAAGQGCIRR